MWLCCFQCVCVCVCVCVRTASCSSLCPEVCFPPLLALLSTDQKESSLVWFLEQSAPPRLCPSFLPHYKEQKNAWKREDGQLYFGEWFEADIKVLFQQRCMWDGASAGGIFPLQGVSGPDVTLMSCSGAPEEASSRSCACTCELDTWLCFWFLNWSCQTLYVLRHTKLWCSVRVFKFYSSTHYFSIPFLSYQMHQHHIMWVSCLQCRSSYF